MGIPFGTTIKILTALFKKLGRIVPVVWVVHLEQTDRTFAYYILKWSS